jgi:hypothetical protein
MMGLLDIDRVRVPRRVAAATQAWLREAGVQGLEGIVLWAGTKAGNTFSVSHAIAPKQHGVRSAEGVAVAVDSAELHRLNVWLFDNNLRLIAQIHSHPGAAYHSATDDAFPIATTAGSLSLVVPDFACRPFDLRECSVYRLSAQGVWLPLPTSHVLSLIEIGD